MFLNKVHDQKVELLRAIFRNMYLKEKCDYLDSECKMLAENILSSQVTHASKSDLKITLENDLNKLKSLNERKMHELTLANEKIISLSMNLEQTKTSTFESLTETKSMNEDLNLKNEMIKCLQEELVHARLEAAEKWALIRELKQIKDELEKEKELLTKTKPETISRLQEEIMQAKILEVQYSWEFDKIKKQLEQMREDILKHKQQDEDCKNKKPEGSLKLSLKGVLWKSNENKNNIEANEILEDIQKLNSEKTYLQSRIPELENKIEILNKHIQFKETEKYKLQENLDNLKVKYQSTENMTLERKRQYDKLKNRASEKVDVVRNSCQEKRHDIDDLSNKLDNISQRRQSYTTICGIKESTTIQNLEEQILILQNRITQLKNEEEIFYKRAYNKKREDVCV